jgi:futalosine hydrolase
MRYDLWVFPHFQHSNIPTFQLSNFPTFQLSNFPGRDAKVPRVTVSFLLSASMRILIGAATAAEIAPLREWLEADWARKSGADVFYRAGTEVELLLTGVGIMEATAALTRALCAREGISLLVLAGIAGAFDRSLQPGDLVVVEEDTVGDLGAEDGEKFLRLADIGLQAEEDIWIKTAVPPLAAFAQYRRVRGITVNTVTGCEDTALLRSRTFDPAVETMEGATAHFVARAHRIPLLHLRAVSNYAERRNRASWKIGPAVSALNKALISWLQAESIM